MSNKIIIKKIQHRDDWVTELVASPVIFAQKRNNNEIAKNLEILSDHYYNGNALVADSIFDELLDILRERDPNHDIFTQIGAPLRDPDEIGDDEREMEAKIAKISGISITNPEYRIKKKLPYWMGSMNKCKPGESKLGNWLAKYPGPYVISDKMDGASALLIYRVGKNGVMTINMYSRGKSDEGQDLSYLIPYLDLPEITAIDIQKIDGSDELTVRGELIMSNTNFKQFSKEWKNPRNTISGVVNSKTLKTGLVEYVDFIAYELICPDGLKASTQFKKLNELAFNCATPVIQDKLTEKWLVDYYTKRWKESDYDIDGLILCQDQVQTRNVGENPRYAIAFKMMVDQESQVKETEVIDVQWNSQKDGYLFPVIKVKPVKLPGVTVSNCSGKTAKFILENCIGPGAKILITRDGDVIPGVYKVLSPATNRLPCMPDPVKFPYHWTATNTDIVLDDPANDPGVYFKKVLSFFRTLGVVGFSEGTLTRCMENGLDSIPKIINAQVGDFLKLPGIQIKSAQKYYENIREALTGVEITKLMMASNTFGRGLGTKKLALLLNEIPTAVEWDTTDLTKRSEYVAKICAIQGFEKKTASLFVDNLQKYKEFVKTLPQWVQNGIVNPYLPQVNQKIKIIPKSALFKPEVMRFTNHKIVFSGVRNKDWEKIIEQEGGKMSTSVSGNTTLVVIKEVGFTSGKVTKAEELGITVLDMETFKNKFKL